MPSPFPGMDPFLEAPEFFPGFHKRFMVFLEEKLQKALPRPYFANTGERIWIEYSQRHIDPDANIHRHNGGRKPQPAKSRPSGGVALVDMPQPVVVKVLSDPRIETFVEIYRDDGKRKRLVCTVEMLSPVNKKAGETAQALYRQKQVEILGSKTHLVELDFLRSGRHTTAVPLDSALLVTGRFDYHVCCHRFDRADEFLVYPIRLQDPLPIIGFPLLGADPDVPIKLQEIFDHAYEAGPHSIIDYKNDKVEPPLRPDLKKWMGKLFKQKGIFP